ncbi:MAG: cyclic nucleotide-binding domain-containing protein [Chloroflexi bacterium]|nr:cyclic nucleotide-binding domain-containing protein [Chloroflexota bacterium]
MMDDLYQIPLFEGISPDELAWLVAHSHEERLENGDYFFKEGGPADRFYIVLEGELQVSRTVDGRDLIMGTTPRGIMGGEMALLSRTPSNVTARAIMPCRLMVFDEPSFRELFSACPVVGMRILQTTAQRMQGTVTILKQQEKMVALGKLSAGLAHELNNPAAAAGRAAQSLRETLPGVQAQTLNLGGLGLDGEQLAALAAFQQRLTVPAAPHIPLPPLEQSTREDEIGAWFEGREIPGGWEMAPAFVNAGVSLDDLAALAGKFSAGQLTPVFRWMHGALETAGLLEVIQESTQRISELVTAIKAYTHMDQAPVQDVDLIQGLESTLTVLRYKLRNVQIVREYDPNLPVIQARGGELNQVWTNLIDNAIDAMQGKGQIAVITRAENNFVMIEIADNGPGIPPEIMPRLFEPFFTTKEVGVGTGLGLDISYRIIQQHHGTIEVQSSPGHTRFIIRLPIQAAVNPL